MSLILIMVFKFRSEPSYRRYRLAYTFDIRLYLISHFQINEENYCLYFIGK